MKQAGPDGQGGGGPGMGANFQFQGDPFEMFNAFFGGGMGGGGGGMQFDMSGEPGPILRHYSVDSLRLRPIMLITRGFTVFAMAYTRYFVSVVGRHSVFSSLRHR